MQDNTWKRLVVEHVRDKPNEEEFLIRKAAAERGIPISEVFSKHMSRGHLELCSGDLVAGSVQFTLDAMRHLGITVPTPCPYPESLKPWFHRIVKKPMPLVNVLRHLDMQGGEVFIKPADRWKRFTGFVASTSTDPRFNGCSLKELVWTSQAVEFETEWRCYCASGKLLDIQQAPDQFNSGFPRPERGELLKAYEAMKAAGDAVDGFVMDFGVLSTGETTLIEVNDGFSFGAYGKVSSDTVYEVISARWKQLLRQRTRNPGAFPEIDYRRV